MSILMYLTIKFIVSFILLRIGFLKMIEINPNQEYFLMKKLLKRYSRSTSTYHFRIFFMDGKRIFFKHCKQKSFVCCSVHFLGKGFCNVYHGFIGCGSSHDRLFLRFSL